jgi:hypothetical protein
MIDQPELSATGKKLANHLERAALADAQPKTETVHVSGVASGIYFAYEQLRNAADYTQRHLVLRSAIERFLRREVYLRDKAAQKVAEDLVIELTQARYLANDSVTKQTVADIDRLITQYVTFFHSITTNHGAPRAKAGQWVYQVLSVLIERLLVPQPLVEGFIDTAYTHYLEAVDRRPFRDVEAVEFEIALYCAVHRSLLKSDTATVRTFWLLGNGNVSFIKQSQLVDTYFDHPVTNRLIRLINRYGAPMRSIRELFIRQGAGKSLLEDRRQLFAQATAVINKQYEQLRHTTVASLWRMLVFVLITKILVGLSIELPYDIFILGTILWLPLAVNLVFPLLYMMSAAFGLRSPGPANTSAILNYIERIIYKTDQPLRYKLTASRVNKQLRSWFNVAYTITFLIPLGLTIWALSNLGFTLLHGIIFFIFLSGVSFFRFRLLQTSREMDIIDRPHTLLSAIGDFFHLPFAKLGHWLSDRYQRLNVITFLLDIAIELPLKTSLRILRQWVGFVSDKREEL